MMRMLLPTRSLAGDEGYVAQRKAILNGPFAQRRLARAPLRDVAECKGAIRAPRASSSIVGVDKPERHEALRRSSTRNQNIVEIGKARIRHGDPDATPCGPPALGAEPNGSCARLAGFAKIIRVRTIVITGRNENGADAAKCPRHAKPELTRGHTGLDAFANNKISGGADVVELDCGAPDYAQHASSTFRSVASSAMR